MASRRADDGSHSTMINPEFAYQVLAAELGAGPFDPIRCAALSDGVLTLGPAVLTSPVPLDAAHAGDAVRQAVRRS